MYTYWASLVAQMVKNPPAMQETRVQSLGREDPLEKGRATRSSILARRIPWTEEPGGLHPWCHRVDTTDRRTRHTGLQRALLVCCIYGFVFHQIQEVFSHHSLQHFADNMLPPLAPGLSCRSEAMCLFSVSSLSVA